MGTVVAVVLAACFLPTPELESWRNRKLHKIDVLEGRLDVVASKLSLDADCPIHFVHGFRYDDMPLIKSTQIGGTSPTLGNAFDVIAAQIPGIRATATPKGVLWRCPLAAGAARPLDAMVKLDRFSSTVTALMPTLFGENVQEIMTGVTGPVGPDPDTTKVESGPLGPVSAIEALVGVADANQFRIKVLLLVPRAGEATTSAGKPILDYQIFSCPTK